jgi:hypothetical protein
LERVLAGALAVDTSFEIHLDSGDVLRFRHLVGRDRFVQLRAAAHRFADGARTSNSPAAMRPYLDVSRDTKIWCWLMGALSMDEGAGELVFLKIQHHAPVLFEMILEEFKAGLVHLDNSAWVREVESAKKG